jgi:hypothetical protein
LQNNDGNGVRLVPANSGFLLQDGFATGFAVVLSEIGAAVHLVQRTH